MSKNSKAGKAAGVAGGAYSAARSNEYVQRLIDDEDLRDSLRDAYDAAQAAYGRVTGSRRGPVKAVASDKKAQKELRKAADALRDAAEQLRGEKKRKHRFGKLLVLGAVGAGVTLALSESARKTVMDTLFGAEEEFEYSSTTSGNSASSTAAQSTPAASTASKAADSNVKTAEADKAAGSDEPADPDKPAS